MKLSDRTGGDALYTRQTRKAITVAQWIDAGSWFHGNRISFLLVLVMLIFSIPEYKREMVGYVWSNMGYVRLIADNNLLFCQRISQNPTHADSFFVKALDYDKENRSTLRGYGISLLASKMDEQAILALEKVELSPTSFFASWGNQSEVNKCEDEALYWYQKAVNINPSLAAVWHRIGIIRLDQGNSDQAIYTLDRAWQLSNADSASPLAWLLYRQADYQQAATILQSALARYPDHEERLLWWRALDASDRAEKQWMDSVVVTKQAMAEYPKDPSLLIGFAVSTYFNSGDYETAFDAIHQAIAIDPNAAWAYGSLGDISVDLQLFEQATEHYTKAIEKEPDNPRWYLSRANAYSSLGDLSEALKQQKNIIGTFPAYAPAYFEIAWLYRLTDEPQLAVDSIEKAIQLLGTRENMQYFLRAGKIYEWVGESKKAAEAYRDVLRLTPDNSEAKSKIIELENR